MLGNRLSTMSDSHSDLATAITAAVTMPQRMLLSLSLVAAAVKSRALAPDASTGCRLAPLIALPAIPKVRPDR
jgi:hypothetical protein